MRTAECLRSRAAHGMDGRGRTSSRRSGRQAERPRTNRGHHSAPGRNGALDRLEHCRNSGEPPGSRAKLCPRTRVDCRPQGTSHIDWTAAPDGTVWVNPTGNPGMATGGTGDILTGMVAGLIAQHPQHALEATALAVYLHGLAGDLAANPSARILWWRPTWCASCRKRSPRCGIGNRKRSAFTRSRKGMPSVCDLSPGEGMRQIVLSRSG